MKKYTFTTVIVVLLLISLTFSVSGCIIYANSKNTTVNNLDDGLVTDLDDNLHDNLDDGRSTAATEHGQSDSIIYENNEYGFRFLLPQSWEGFEVLSDTWEGMSIEDSTDGKVVETGSVISIRHPNWTVQNPRQDIPIMIFTIEQCNFLKEEKFSIGAAPVGPKELSRSSKYVFALPARYNYAFLPGYEEVEEILKNNPLKPLDKAETETAESHIKIVNVYFMCTTKAPGGLYPVDRKVPADADPIRAAIEEMLKGPTEEEKKLGYMSNFSDLTADMLNSITRSDDGKIITIDFADFRHLLDRDKIPSPTSFLPGGIMADITWTIFKQFPDVDGLRFSFDGDEKVFWFWLAGEEYEPQIFTRKDWEQV